MSFFIKDDVKVKVPNRTPIILLLSDGVVNWDGVLKSNCKPKGDHVMHFLGWIKKPITQNSVWKCSYVNDTIERGPMM
jgi:hypothetical protein